MHRVSLSLSQTSYIYVNGDYDYIIADAEQMR